MSGLAKANRVRIQDLCRGGKTEVVLSLEKCLRACRVSNLHGVPVETWGPPLGWSSAFSFQRRVPRLLLVCEGRSPSHVAGEETEARRGQQVAPTGSRAGLNPVLPAPEPAVTHASSAGHWPTGPGS